MNIREMNQYIRAIADHYPQRAERIKKAGRDAYMAWRGTPEHIRCAAYLVAMEVEAIAEAMRA